jgi:hypothetical protein
MQWRQVATVLFLFAASAVGVRTHAATIIAPGMTQTELAAHSNPGVQKVYWAWRGGARFWVQAPPPYAYPYRWGPRPYYYGRPPYWYGGRGYWHRGWYRGGWRYW